MTPSRRSFLTGLAATIITAPAIVRVGSLMPVKVMEPTFSIGRWEGITIYETDDMLVRGASQSVRCYAVRKPSGLFTVMYEDEFESFCEGLASSQLP